MKKSTLLMLLALAPLAVQPACAPDDGETTSAEDSERAGTTASALLGGSKILWPMQDGKATVRVCWLPLDLGGEIAPGGPFGVDPAKVMPERKQWVREGVEREWNGRTVLKFVGWEDCGDAEVDVKIQPITTLGRSYCPQPSVGQSCVEKIGLPVKGKRVFITMLFGDEAIGEARYLQTVTQTSFDASKVLPNGPAIPAVCGPEMVAYGRHFFTDNQPVTNADIASIQAVYQSCLQNMSNHEFGHLAGFSHEQNRDDTSASCRARYAAAIPDDPSDQDSPLGNFEEDSIMSYCRITIPGTLTAEDVSQTNAFYAANAPKLPDSVKPKSDTPADPTGGTSTDEGSDTPAPVAAPKKKKAAAAIPSKGGCNG